MPNNDGRLTDANKATILVLFIILQHLRWNPAASYTAAGGTTPHDMTRPNRSATQVPVRARSTPTDQLPRWIVVLVWALTTIGCSPGSTVEPFDSGIVCDLFELRWDLDGEDLLLAIHTDLPDEAQLFVRVGRPYYYVGRDAPYVGSDTRYEHEYFDVLEPVSRWREHRRIALDAEVWRADVAATESVMGDVASISDNIHIRAFLPPGQDLWRFGPGNRNLTGAATSRITNGIVVRTETSFEFPLD